MKHLLLILVLQTVSGQFVEDADHHMGQPNLVQLAKQLNLTKFAAGVEQTGLDKILDNLGYFTIFAPTDDAFDHEKFYPQEDGIKDKLKFHIATDLYKSSDIKNELTVKSMLSKRTIRFNIYKKGQIVTANGRPIVSVDHLARNGVIHIVSEVMSSVYKRQGSVVSEIDECCPQHSILLELIKEAKLFDVLDTKGPFTFFAPLNGAFEKLPSDFLDHLRKDIKLLRGVLLAHVVPDTWYSVGLSDGQKLKTVFGNKLNVGVSSDESITVGKAAVSLADVTAGNGVIHSIDEVLIPKHIINNNVYNRMNKFYVVEDNYGVKEEEDKPVGLVEKLKQKGFTSFHDALVKTGLDKTLSSGLFTVFAPSNSAFDRPAGHDQPDLSLADRVKFHIAKGIVKPEKVSDGDRMDSVLDGRFVTFNTYTKKDGSQLILANGREVSFTGYEANNGVIHEIKDNKAMDYVYSRTNGTLFKEISSIPRFSKFTTFLRESGLVHFLDDPQYSYTVLVPSNDVLDSLNKSDSDRGTRAVLSRLFVDHVLSDTWYTEGMAVKPYVRALSGKIIRVSLDDEGLTKLDDLRIIKADYTTLNGVFHEVDGILN